jgi:hypothetical protein
MGLIFVAMGLNGLVDFIAQPSTPMPAKAFAILAWNEVFVIL